MAYSDLAALLAMVAAGVGDAVGPAMLRAVTTHRHPDHLGALAELVRRTGVRHTPGGIALALANAGQTHFLVGDPLFPGGVGRTTSPPDFSQLSCRRHWERSGRTSGNGAPAVGDPTTESPR